MQKQRSQANEKKKQYFIKIAPERGKYPKATVDRPLRKQNNHFKAWKGSHTNKQTGH